jgi:hypothetical protein
MGSPSMDIARKLWLGQMGASMMHHTRRMRKINYAIRRSDRHLVLKTAFSRIPLPAGLSDDLTIRRVDDYIVVLGINRRYGYITIDVFLRYGTSVASRLWQNQSDLDEIFTEDYLDLPEPKLLRIAYNEVMES